MRSHLHTTIAKVVSAATLLMAVVVGGEVRGDVRLPNVVGSNMVLQRDMPVSVWGWASPGEAVSVEIGSQRASAETDGSGRWSVQLPAMPAGGPHTMSVAGKNTIKLENILVGEVWVCSGQSNMQWPVSRSLDFEKEAAMAKFPEIRLFQVPMIPAGLPRDNVNATWKACSPESIPNFSAVSYFFGRELHQELDVPIGLIQTAWGGTRIEPWTPIIGFESVPEVASIADDVRRTTDKYRVAAASAVETYAEWLTRADKWLSQAQKAVAAKREIAAPPAWPRDPVANRGYPTGLYNGMVHALVPYRIRGAIWYQGESNNGEGMLYHEKMKALINGWRTVWDQGDFPFLFVQLAPYHYNGDPTRLAGMWEAQLETLRVPNTGMAVTTDIANVKDIHPKNKQDVGRRLALWALAKSYGRDDVVYSGPLYKSMAVEGSKIRLTFDHAGGGLKSRDDKPLDWFTIAGEDGAYVPAVAEIDGETLLISSDKVAKPNAVQFGWNQEAEPNLVNGTGLPASPFRTRR